LHKYTAVHSLQAANYHAKSLHDFSTFSQGQCWHVDCSCLSQVNDDCRPSDLLKPTQAEVQGQLEAIF